jgi:hypothetical protein
MFQSTFRCVNLLAVTILVSAYTSPLTRTLPGETITLGLHGRNLFQLLSV